MSIVGALGHRKALFGYSGHLPTELKPGDIVQLLNLGGVIGICDSINPSHGEPFDCRVLGVRARFPVLGPARRRAGARVERAAELSTSRSRPHGIPVVALAGTCMNSGKTAAACAIVSRFRHNGLVVDAFKATGVALRRDILAMEDAGARNTAIFTDFGICATTSKNAPALTRNLLNERHGREARRDRVRARRRLARRLRRRGDPARHRDSSARSRRSCCARTTPSAPGAARSCCARSSASSLRSSPAPRPTTKSASTSSRSARTSPRSTP